MHRRPAKPLHNARRHPVALAEVAFRELSMPGSLHSRADEERLWRIWRGLQYLDDDQANVRNEIARLLVDFARSANVVALVAGLKTLAAMSPERLAEEDERERVTARQAQANRLIRGLSERRDVRSPLERMIDKACGVPGGATGERAR